MATTKVTFTLDDATIARLQEAATRLTMPKSEVVRAAIAEYYDRIELLSERERLRLLRAFDELVPRIPAHSAAEVDRELKSIRQARRAAGRRHAS
jgi:aminoglycoside phosphotransferase